ncbi:MAG: quinone-dependent dihydroorotate dehydrogenase [Chitinophagaceae bacterium]
MYRIVRGLFFLIDAEKAHYRAMDLFKFLCSIPFVHYFIRRLFVNDGKQKSTELFGLSFKNQVGLAAGFDKNALYLRELETLGFGFIEIGTVTPQPQAGNEKPRLFRLPEDQALVNRMGFNNDGVVAVAERLKAWVSKRSSRSAPSARLLIGGNIGKNKTTPNEEASRDYETCFHALHPYVDFFVVNVSSPNTPGLRALQEKGALREILTHLQKLNSQKNRSRPILLKIAPDLGIDELDDVISIAMEINLDGLVATNTTIERSGLVTSSSKVQSIGTGGLSGAPLRKRSTEVIDYINKKTGGVLPVVASGGIFTADNAKEKLSCGASLVEVWTGFIYEGPFIAKRISKSLIK